jgi:hypothetical protein
MKNPGILPNLDAAFWGVSMIANIQMRKIN